MAKHLLQLDQSLIYHTHAEGAPKTPPSFTKRNATANTFFQKEYTVIFELQLLQMQTFISFST